MKNKGVISNYTIYDKNETDIITVKVIVSVSL